MNSSPKWKLLSGRYLKLKVSWVWAFKSVDFGLGPCYMANSLVLPFAFKNYVIICCWFIGGFTATVERKLGMQPLLITPENYGTHYR